MPSSFKMWRSNVDVAQTNRNWLDPFCSLTSKNRWEGYNNPSQHHSLRLNTSQLP